MFTNHIIYAALANPELVNIALSVGFAGIVGFLWVVCMRYYRRSAQPCIADVADLLEQSVIDRIGEREFSRQLLEFDEHAQHDYIRAVNIVAGGADQTTCAISYCWLARHGYGRLCLETLWTDLERHRRRALHRTNT